MADEESDNGSVVSGAGDLNESGPEDVNYDPSKSPNMPMSEALYFKGYDKAAPFGDPFTFVPAPPAVALSSGKPPPMSYGNIENLREEQCREAMLNFVAANCCFGKGTAKEHKIKSIKPFTSFHYVLETYSEGRKTGNMHVPFKGQDIDGPENGQPPPPWAIECAADELFRNHTKLIEVPHTAYVKTCHQCSGNGKVTCGRCSGKGRVRCGRCHGKGKRRSYNRKRNRWISHRCGSCGGYGKKTCFRCHGSGRVTCRTCDGSGHLKCYIELEVSFINHVEDHIYEPTDMPDELIAQAQGQVIFEQQLFQVWPVKDFPVPDIANKSIKMVEQHHTKWPNERQLQQRHHLRQVPVTEVDAVWKDWTSRYWVFGFDRQIYSPDYPQTCCWGCNIL